MEKELNEQELKEVTGGDKRTKFSHNCSTYNTAATCEKARCVWTSGKCFLI